MESLETVEVTINLRPLKPWDEVLIAELSDAGFHGFVQSKKGIQAYASTDIDVDQVLKESVLADAPNSLTYSVEKKVIPHQNWNAKWEEEFQPVEVEEYITIRAPFHEASSGREVVIQPQMSFGTGHHQTTWMMTKALFELKGMPQDVLDMGTGTGVLAIVAEQLGAQKILAVDIEEWSAENARENCDLNNCSKVETICGDIDVTKGYDFGLIIANINKNVLKSHMDYYVSMLSDGGKLLLSGFFKSDVDEMVTYCSAKGLTLEKQFEKDEWAALQLHK